MTLFQYAIARAFKQLTDLETQRPLTDKEKVCLADLALTVDRYEARENKRVKVVAEIPSRTEPSDEELNQESRAWLNTTRP